MNTQVLLKALFDSFWCVCIYQLLASANCTKASSFADVYLHSGSDYIFQLNDFKGANIEEH